MYHAQYRLAKSYLLSTYLSLPPAMSAIWPGSVGSPDEKANLLIYSISPWMRARYKALREQPAPAATTIVARKSD